MFVKTEKKEWKFGREKQREKMFKGLTTWLDVGSVTDALIAKKDADVWKDIITTAEME